MAYRELINVANGTKGQIDACISALDLHENAPDEVEQLTSKLEEAVQICETIISKGNDEPDEQTPNAGLPAATTTQPVAAAPSNAAASSQEDSQKEQTGEKEVKIPNIF